MISSLGPHELWNKLMTSEERKNKLTLYGYLKLNFNNGFMTLCGLHNKNELCFIILYMFSNASVMAQHKLIVINVVKVRNKTCNLENRNKRQEIATPFIFRFLVFHFVIYSKLLFGSEV